MSVKTPILLWLSPGQDFPPIIEAWDSSSPAPGLLAAGGALNSETLKKAYSLGIFPWYSDGQPILWWSPDPRMVLDVSKFRLHSSFKKTLVKFIKAEGCEVKFDTCANDVIEACASSRRRGQSGTWIVRDMIDAYTAIHHDGLTHSVEIWVDKELVGGLYCIAIGKFIFGESMFSRVPNSSKIALAALVAFCRLNGIKYIDCQQNTSHLTSLGAEEISRALFNELVLEGLAQVAPAWEFNRSDWSYLLPLNKLKL